MPFPSGSPMLTGNFSSASADEKRRGRQRPGTACLECRSKKLKCDGEQPQCGKCIASGMDCTPTTQAPRGPKRGHLKILQTKIEILEQRLAETQSKYGSSIESADLCSYEPFPSSTDVLFDMNEVYLPSPISQVVNPFAEPANALPDSIHPISNIETWTTSPMRAVGIPDSLDPQSNLVWSDDFLRTDLDQLYFERVQHSVPILHKRNYFSWARSPAKSESQVCLQYAMWTLAASLASQLQDIRESLYQCTQRLLDSLECRDEISPTLEHVQARLLMCLYELMRKSHQRGWMSAGRCFRLIQLMRLHEADSPDNRAKRKIALETDDCLHREERRRTFWVAYSLDLFLSVREKWPLTLHEHNISTCLPIPEDNFQTGNYIEMPCLSDALQSLNQHERSPFAESIILAFICRHLTVHRQRSAIDGLQGNVPQTFWDRHNRLEEMVKTRASLLSSNYPETLQHSDPMLLFTSIMAHSLVLCLCGIVESVLCESHEYQNAVAAFRQRSMVAARSIIGLSRSLAHLTYLKVHPLTPLPLCICIEFLDAHRYLDESTSSQIQEIYGSLREMGNVSNLAKDYLLE